MTNVRFLAILSILGLSVLASCKKDSVIPPDPYFRNYFPNKVGSYIIYDCDSIVYDDFNNRVDTFRFKIKELYHSQFTDNSGRSAIRLERWKKPADTLSYFLKDVWQVVKDENQVEKVEEDVRFIKMIFPVKSGREWNVNALNSLGSRMYSYEDAHTAYSNGTLNFDSTVTMRNLDPENLVSEYRNTEIFATNVGMVYKSQVDVAFIIPTPVIKSGYKFTMRAIEVGIE
jgi:hypothetical protein